MNTVFNNDQQFEYLYTQNLNLECQQCILVQIARKKQ